MFKVYSKFRIRRVQPAQSHPSWNQLRYYSPRENHQNEQHPPRDQNDSFKDTASREQEKVDIAKSFEALNSTSIGTMTRILNILKDAETQPADDSKRDRYYYLPAEDSTKKEEPIDPSLKYSNRFSTVLGTEIFEYNVVKFLNDKEVVARNEEFWNHDPRSALALYHSYAEKFKQALTQYVRESRDSFLSDPNVTMNGSLNMFQSITKHFIENNGQCHNRIRKDLRRMSKQILTHQYSNFANKFDYGLPRLKIPSSQEFTYSDSPLNLNYVLPTEKDALNLTPFLLNDHQILNSFLKITKNPSTPPEMLRGIMLTKELEGQLIFKIMIKKKMQLINELKNQKIIRNFLNKDTADPNEESDIDIVKSIMASRSSLPSRIASSRIYKAALTSGHNLNFDDDKAIIKQLAGQFDRYFGIVYRIGAKDVDRRITSLINYYIENHDTGNIQEELKQALARFRNDMEGIQLSQLGNMWSRRERNHSGADRQQSKYSREGRQQPKSTEDHNKDQEEGPYNRLKHYGII